MDKDPLILAEVVPFINGKGDETHWKRPLTGYAAKYFCENSNSELMWTTDGNGEMTMLAKGGQFGRLQPSRRSSTTTVTVPSKISC